MSQGTIKRGIQRTPIWTDRHNLVFIVGQKVGTPTLRVKREITYPNPQVGIDIPTRKWILARHEGLRYTKISWRWGGVDQ
jgi:hypothetical protein